MFPVKNCFSLLRILFQILILFCLVPASGTVVADRTDGKDFFRQVLIQGYHSVAGGLSKSAEEDELQISDIPTARAAVWNLWRMTCAETEVPAFPAWDRLRSDTSYVWTIPDSLEQKVQWRFYYGAKGEGCLGKRPFFLYLHGSGPSEQEWSTGYQLAGMFDDGPSVYVVPRIPSEKQYRWWNRSKQWAVEHILREAMLCDSIDADRLYIFGISEGGYGSQRLASFYADYLAGAGPMAGGEPLRNAPVANIGHIAFSLLTGAEDRMFYRDRLTRKVAEALQCSDSSGLSIDGRHRVCLIPGRGHHIDYRPTTPWLRRFVRDPRPRCFEWEDMEMDGRHRDGFYNLEVIGRPCDSLRQHYRVEMRPGRVDIEVSNVRYEVLERDPQFGIELAIDQQLEPVSGGQLCLYFDEKQYDEKRKYRIYVNGKRVFKGRLRPSRVNMLRSCALFYDPERVFPYAVEFSY